MLDNGTYEVVLLIGIISGLAVRTGFYFYSKQKEDEQAGAEPRSFEAKYLGTAVLAGVLTFVGALMAFPLVAAAVPNEGSLVAVLSASFIMAIGLNEVFNKIIAIGGLPLPMQTAKAEKA